MFISAVAFLTGVGLMVLPETEAFARPGADLLQIVGPIAGAVGYVSAFGVTRGLRRLNVVTALALLLGSPLVGMPLSGVAVVWAAAFLLGLTAVLGRGMPVDRYAGGWRSLLG